jgi:outer membrane lipoprotein-sorting protein
MAISHLSGVNPPNRSQVNQSRVRRARILYFNLHEDGENMLNNCIPNIQSHRCVKTLSSVLLYLIILLMPLISHIKSVSAEEKLSDILDGIRKRYADLPGLSVPYQREIISSSMALLGDSTKTDLATGKIFLKPPYFIMVQQETPSPETLTSDGNTLWWYLPQKNQVYEYPSDRLGKELYLLVDIFLGLRKMEESFDVMQTGLGDEGAFQLTLIPNPRWEEIDHIDILVKRGDFQIRKVEIHNTIGGITRFILGELAVQKKIKDSFFRFVVPDGVKVIKEGN